MSGETSYNELHEKVIKLEMLIGLTDNADGQVDVMTQIHGINTELTDYHVTVDNQLDGLVTFI